MRLLLSSALAVLILAGPRLALADDEPGSTPSPKGGSSAASAKPLDVSKLPFTEYSIKQVVRFHQPDIQTCYEGVIAEMGKAPPEGKVYVTFSVLASGLTSMVKVDKKQTTIKNDKVQDCVTDAIKGWEFPKPTDGREHPLAMPFSLKVNK